MGEGEHNTNEAAGMEPPRVGGASTQDLYEDDSLEDTLSACVARTVPRKELQGNPEAKASLQKEWDKLRNIGNKGIGAWDESKVRSAKALVRECTNPSMLHLGSLHELCVEKGSELNKYNPD